MSASIRIVEWADNPQLIPESLPAAATLPERVPLNEEMSFVPYFGINPVKKSDQNSLKARLEAIFVRKVYVDHLRSGFRSTITIGFTLIGDDRVDQRIAFPDNPEACDECFGWNRRFGVGSAEQIKHSAECQILS